MSDRRVLVHADTSALTGSVAARFITKMIDLLDDQSEVHIALTGGGVGTGVLSAIDDSGARDSIDWSRVHVWWGDERFVAAGSEERNDTGARAALLDHLDIPDDHIHPFPSTDDGIDLEEAAERYAAELARHAPEGGHAPVFDITFLGVGPDGHIASLFPDLDGIRERERSVVAVHDAPKPPPARLSLTLPVINGSDRIWLCLAGADKASALGLALAGASTEEVPVAGANGRKRTVFFVDREAAAEVPGDLISPEY